LLIATEVGTDSIVGVPGIDVANIETASDYYRCLEHAVSGRSQWGFSKVVNSQDKGNSFKEQLKFLGMGSFTGERYRTIVLDTATKLRKNRIVELFAAQGKEVPASKPFLYASKEWKDVWIQCSHDLMKMLQAILDIPRSNELSIVINSHEVNLTHDEGTSPAMSEFLKPNISSAIGKSVSDFLNAEVSYMGQTVIRDKTETQQQMMGDISIPTKVKVGTEYVLRVGPDPIYRTKFRRSINITTPLPDFIVDPTYEKILKVIKGEM
jgi:hypothetical protein